MRVIHLEVDSSLSCFLESNPRMRVILSFVFVIVSTERGIKPADAGNTSGIP